MTGSSPWDPALYARFAHQRAEPFWDLCSLLEPVEGPNVVDLGCGDGRLTAALHRRSGSVATVGIDASPTMLAAAQEHRSATLSFHQGDIARWRGEGVDLVVSNAAIQWVPHHHQVLRRWRRGLAPGGQLAVQMPCNADHPSHRILRQVGSRWLGDAAPGDPVHENVWAPERYAQALHDLGFERQHVRLQVYGHLLDTSAQLVDWMRGTSLTRFAALLPGPRFDRFVEAYGHQLLAEVGEQRPYFYTFKRILLWGRLPRR